MTRRLGLMALLATALAYYTACGGGAGATAGGAGSPSMSVAAGSALTITTGSILPGTLQGHAYTVTLTASNGQGALHWSIAPISATALSVNGLAIDPNTGVLSGTANFAGTAGFLAQVTDSASPPQTASKAFTVTAYGPLSAAPNANTTPTLLQFDPNFVFTETAIQGGVPPLTFAFSSGPIPRGMRLNPQTGDISGAPLDVGTFSFVLTVQDSFSPAESINQPFTITVKPHDLVVVPSIPRQMALNRPFTGKVIAIGGIPPYSFALQSAAALPPGLTFDPATATVGGTPTSAGTYLFTVSVKDSSSPANSSLGNFIVIVAPPLGRNDTPATATLIANGAVNASISPYIDPPNGVPTAGDSDFYKIVSLGGATVHVQTVAKQNFPNNPLDTVIQITDGNGRQLSSCRQPGDTSTNFTSPCVNDDISATPHIQDSALDFQVPGATNTPTAFYVQVLDWRGDARPDMIYQLQVSGAVAPLSITTATLIPAGNGLPYNQQLTTINGTGAITWSVVGGALPSGLTLSSTGAITGTATTNGTFTFTVQAVDSGNPPQTATAAESIVVGSPVKIISSPTLPAACVNQPYTFTVQTSGGVAPLAWFFSSSLWPSINFSQSGVFSGTANITGTFTGTLGVADATGNKDSQQVTLSVNQCP